ncbi:unnamed protein product [Caenorhabditis auriculariae]|uniref:ascorbate ferrireductase (transmembrane) n=1 Tax=Caenorhabditis auriculariae TaxID=2777116 RepID=A0A8S1HG05_9PELO|nr:unnamed protein product [Caenorhabditis auriculariae]
MAFLRFLLISCCILKAVWTLSFSECNVTRSCWHQPPACAENNQGVCMSGVEWQILPEGVLIEIEAQTSDLDQTRPFYAAVGFSYNQRMDDDTVFECVVTQTGTGQVQLSFNDESFNHVLPQASSVMVTDGSTSFVDGVLTCSGKILLDNKHLVAKTQQFMVLFTILKNQPHYLLFARGNADPFTLEKDIHSTNDGSQFPWMSDEMVRICRNCSDHDLYHVTRMRQTYHVERYWRYRIAVWHGILMMFAWWVLASTAILIARYFKPLFPRTKLLGTAVWFQFHRDMMVASVVIQVICIFFIFYQAGWIWYQCSYLCTSDDFAKKMHAITGFTATVLAVMQPIGAALRPAPSSENRIWFSWGHWLFGMFAWCLATATIVLSLPIGKTGLNRVFGHLPNWIVLGYILFFVGCMLLLEILTSPRSGEKAESGIQPHRFTVGPTGMALANLNTPIRDAPIPEPKQTKLRVLIVLLHVVVSLCVVITFAVMLFKNLYSHSP